MSTVIVSDIDQGEIALQELPLDAVLQPNRGQGVLWEGAGADRLNAAIERGWFPWPQRVDQVWLLGQSVLATAPDGQARLLAGYPHPQTGILDQDAIDYRERYWPLSLRQIAIPSVVAFAIDALPGTRITGRLLVEVQ